MTSPCPHIAHASIPEEAVAWAWDGVRWARYCGDHLAGLARGITDLCVYTVDWNTPVDGPPPTLPGPVRPIDDDPDETPRPEPVRPTISLVVRPADLARPRGAPGTGHGSRPARPPVVPWADADAHPERCRADGCHDAPRTRGLCKRCDKACRRQGRLDIVALHPMNPTTRARRAAAVAVLRFARETA